MIDTGVEPMAGGWEPGSEVLARCGCAGTVEGRLPFAEAVFSVRIDRPVCGVSTHARGQRVLLIGGIHGSAERAAKPRRH